MTRTRSVALYWLQLLVLPVVIILAWWFGSAGSTNAFFPPLSGIVQAMWDGFVSGELLSDLWASLSNVFLGLFIAIVLGVGLGVLIGSNDTLRRVLEPALELARGLPLVALIPFIVIVLGIGAGPRIFLVALACFWPILLNSIEGARGVTEGADATAKVYRIRPELRLVRVTFPTALPQIMTGIRVAVATAYVVMVASELMGSTQGLGFFLIEASQNFAFSQMWAGTITIGLLGFATSLLVKFVEKQVLWWYYASGASSGE